jgi:ABC-type uncharacterized transport system substrate-binding protein
MDRTLRTLIAKPAIISAEFSMAKNLPICRFSATKTQLIINFKTAKALGITISPPVSGRADEVIE